VKTRDWKDIAEVVGIGAIVASLVFVGLQMRQSHEIALVTLYQMRADAAREVMVAGMESEGLISAFEKLDAGQALTNTDHYHLESLFSLVFNHFENSHFLYQRGFLTEEHWQSDLVNLVDQLEETQAIEFWNETKHVYRQSYVDAIEAALRQLEVAEQAR